jgi:hypothetical protein
VYDKNTFDARNVEPQVQRAMDDLVFAHQERRKEGSIYGAEDTFRKKLQQLEKSPTYIEAARQRCKALGEDWRKRNGINQA